MINDVDLKRICVNPLNPRRRVDPAKLQELAESIRQKGVLSPILLRPVPTKDEQDLVIIFGERRYRAAVIAGLTTIPAEIVSATDKEAWDLAMVENLQREDIDPLEEADAVFRAHMDFHEPAEEIATRLGKSVSWVRGRLALAQLVPTARQAVAEGKILLSVAQMIARLDHERQEQAAAYLAGCFNAPLSLREAVSYVQRTFLLRLQDAPWDLADGGLLPAAGPCSACLKRTGAQPDLFDASAKSPDLCLDAKCYAQKQEALWQVRVKTAKETRQPVMDEAESKKTFAAHGSLLPRNGYIDLQAPCYDDPKQRRWIDLLKEAKITPTLARDPEGGIRELMLEDEAKKALKAVGVDLAKERKKAEEERRRKEREQEKAREEKASKDPKAQARDLREQVATRALELMIADIEGGGTAEQPSVLAFMLKTIKNTWGGRRAFERRNINDVEAWCKTATPAKLLALLFELECGEDLDQVWEGYSDELKEACDLFKIDISALEQELQPPPPAPSNLEPMLTDMLSMSTIKFSSRIEAGMDDAALLDALRAQVMHDNAQHHQIGMHDERGSIVCKLGRKPKQEPIVVYEHGEEQQELRGAELAELLRKLFPAQEPAKKKKGKG